MINDDTTLLFQLHPEPLPASLMPIDDEDIVSIHSGQAEAGEFYTNAEAFYEKEYKKEIPFKEYFNLDGSAEENEYIFPLSSPHSTDADVQYPYSPQYVDYILSSLHIYLLIYHVRFLWQPHH